MLDHRGMQRTDLAGYRAEGEHDLCLMVHVSPAAEGCSPNKFGNVHLPHGCAMAHLACFFLGTAHEDLNLSLFLLGLGSEECVRHSLPPQYVAIIGHATNILRGPGAKPWVTATDAKRPSSPGSGGYREIATWHPARCVPLARRCEALQICGESVANLRRTGGISEIVQLYLHDVRSELLRPYRDKYERNVDTSTSILSVLKSDWICFQLQPCALNR